MCSTHSVREVKLSNTKPKIALIDGDIVCYRIGFASEQAPEWACAARLDEFILSTLQGVGCSEYEGYLTGQGNFRETIAVTAPYKGQRSGVKPIHYNFIRDYLQSKWEFVVVDGEEADDRIAIRATSLADEGIICSIDKDFDQIPGWKYNFVKGITYYVTEREGIKAFYRQILTGDRIDNVIGLRGIGPVKANKILDGASGELDCYQRVLQEYAGEEQRVLENGRLLWLRRYHGQLWEPPSLSESSTSEGN